VLPLLKLRRQMDYRTQGGAPLLGVNGIAIIAHGKSDALAIQNAIAQARQAVNDRIVATIATALETIDFVPPLKWRHLWQPVHVPIVIRR
jgi:glycerol-3-phosphate acyltransferase PlsX